MASEVGVALSTYDRVVAFEHLGVTRWPFPTVPDPDFCTFVADREQLRADLNGLLQALGRHNSSDIHLLWSWYGAGKTHTLYYLMSRCAESLNTIGTRMHTVYSEFPKAPRSFLDLYRAFALGLDIEEVIEAYLEIYTSPKADSLRRRRPAPDRRSRHFE